MIGKSRPGAGVILHAQLRPLRLVASIPFLIMAAILFMLVSDYQVYANALQHTNGATEFSSEFKRRLDADMMDYVISSRPENELPLEQVERAKDRLRHMQSTTVSSENQGRIGHMLMLCEQQREAMLQTANMNHADDKTQSLRDHVFPLTQQIQDDMNHYVYGQLKALSTWQTGDGKRTVIYVAFFISVGLILLLLAFSLYFARRITRPIHQLCQKLKSLGDGELTVSPIQTSSAEIKMLDEGLNKMAKQIQDLHDRVKEEQNLRRVTELELLQAQISPHFLYNTLESILWLTEARRVDEAMTMLINLSTFFRNALSKGQGVITLREEEEQVRSYLDIQKIRYQDILQYETDIPNNLLFYSIPKLTLQPLVENAIEHGIKKRRGKGKITILGREEGGDILITVHDNGCGVNAERLEALRRGMDEERYDGFGLLNVHKRLKLYFGEPYGLFFESVLGEGTTVTVRIPKKIQPTQ